MREATLDIPLELGDIQGTVLRHRPPRYYGAYLLYRVDSADEARASLSRALPFVTSAADWTTPKPFTLNIVFTFNGLAALGLPGNVLAGFPQEFRAGMAARKEILGDVGPNDPANWADVFRTGQIHIGLVISSESPDALAAPLELAQDMRGLTMVYKLDIAAPSTGREHFGYRDSINDPLVIGSGSTPHPGQDSIMPGEFVFGYPDESGSVRALRGAEEFTRNGSLLAFRQLHCDVAGFRRFLRANARSADDEELIAAKIMGRWRSGAPLMLTPDRDDSQLAADSARNDDFVYESDPKGLLCPLGSHIRRVNPRDGLRDSVVDPRIHRVLRRGAAYGPTLPDGVLEDDGVERGIVFIFMGTGLAQQFEFVQQVWINKGDFVGLGGEKDPLVGNNDGTGTFTIPAKPVRRRLNGLPAFTTVRGGEYCFLPGLDAMRQLAR